MGLMRRRTLLGGISAGLSFFTGCTALIEASENDSSQTSTTTESTPTATSTTKSTQTSSPQTATSTQKSTQTTSPQTATSTQTPTATSTSTPPPPGTPTATATPARTVVPTPPPTATQTKPVDTQTLTLQSVTQFETYTNDVYAYQINYPPNWSINESDPTNAFIRSNVVRGYILVQVFSVEEFTGGRSIASLEKLVEITNKNSRSLVGFQLFDQDRITLDNGRPAYLIDLQFNDQNTRADMVHTKYLLTKLGGTVYEAQFYWPASAYTEEVNQIANEIITSFTLLI